MKLFEEIIFSLSTTVVSGTSDEGGKRVIQSFIGKSRRGIH